MSLQPTYFIPHGAGPCFFMDWDPAEAWEPMARFLRAISASLPEPPRAILVVSGHWLESEFCATSAAEPSLIYDYRGFPEHTYHLQYPVPGAPALAERVVKHLQAAGLAARTDPARGLDHGVFIPLRLMFPEANIPVMQLSLRDDLDARAHLQAGQALEGLRQEAVLIVGSGMSFHNMAGYNDPRFTAVSAEFDAWLRAAVESAAPARNSALTEWEQAPQARRCHPARQEEHLLPLMVAAGAGGTSVGHRVFRDCVMRTWLSAFRFG